MTAATANAILERLDRQEQREENRARLDQMRWESIDEIRRDVKDIKEQRTDHSAAGDDDVTADDLAKVDVVLRAVSVYRRARIFAGP
jgi:hypothetical protein